MSQDSHDDPFRCHHPHHPLTGEDEDTHSHSGTAESEGAHPDDAHFDSAASHTSASDRLADHSHDSPAFHEHASGHDPTQGHSHSHGQRPHRPRQRRALLFCVILTFLMMIVESVAGFKFGSLMLISDAIHMLSHAAALGISLLAVWIAQRRTTSRLSFGLYRVEILAAFVNGIGLAVFSLWIVYEGIQRILYPIVVHGPEMTIVAVIGLVVNLTTAFVLARAGLEDLNTKSAFLHMLADTFSSVAIVIGGIIISFTHWNTLDPLLSIVVAAMVARWSWGLLRDSTLILLEAKPPHIDAEKVKTGLTARFPEIKAVHDLHIWEVTSQYVCLSAHLVVEDGRLSDEAPLVAQVREFLRKEFGIAHVVLQLEA